MESVPHFTRGSFLLSGDGVFLTLQGEGPSMGLPAVFVRLHRCNLQCDWSGAGGSLCDAAYTWDEQMPEYWSEHQQLTHAELYGEIVQHSCSRVVFTGGEPLLQQRELADFIESKLAGYCIEIETNGTVTPGERLIKLGVQFNCSPKLSNTGIPEKIRIRPQALEVFREYEKAFFKFVVCSVSDIEEIQALQEEYEIPSERIGVMPEGVDTERLSDVMREINGGVLAAEYRLYPRLHIALWGNERGR